MPLPGGGAERPLQTGARVETGEGHPKADAFEHQLALGDRARALRPLALRRAAQQFGGNSVGAQDQDFPNARDARMGPNIDWDEGNSRKSVDKHRVSQVEAEQVFFNEPLLVVEDKRHSGREARFHALGRSDAGRLLQCHLYPAP